MKVCVLFFLLMGKDWDSCNNISPAWKRQHFVPFFTCWFEGKKLDFVFGCFLLHKENKMRKFQTTFACFKKATKHLTILNPFFTKRTTYSNIVSFLQEKHESGEMHESGNDFATLGSQQAAKHFHLDSLFFPLYSFFRRRSSHFKLVVQHVKMKPAKRLS